VETFANRRRLGWTAMDGVCDDCKETGPVSVLHVGRDGTEPDCPLVALCPTCLVRGLDPATSTTWSTPS
jgi:hypothetical protein